MAMFTRLPAAIDSPKSATPPSVFQWNKSDGRIGSSVYASERRKNTAKKQRDGETADGMAQQGERDGHAAEQNALHEFDQRDFAIIETALKQRHRNAAPGKGVARHRRSQQQRSDFAATVPARCRMGQQNCAQQKKKA